jgi:hypothetical protein
MPYRVIGMSIRDVVLKNMNTRRLEVIFATISEGKGNFSRSRFVLDVAKVQEIYATIH